MINDETMIAMVSGGFDPLHHGHVRLIHAARAFGRVVVALNSDAWLVEKKGYSFMTFGERYEILLALRDVSVVLGFDDLDGTACDALRRVRPHYFCNGGDRTKSEEQERLACVELGVKQLFGVGGGKIQSSGGLVATVTRAVF